MGEEPAPDIQPKPPLAQRQAVPSAPGTCHRAEIGACPSSSPHEEVGDCDEVSPQTPLLQAEQTQCPQPPLTRVPLVPFTILVASLDTL
ncbi:hypothetical protein DUI87_25638 [Hirundo rustica rustica]|uniref:Uncharacterized protein n=1 Tax=Hirundo rustica rustica TaxID=333673 RepID=A0A3M0JB98_HIRRU|nr:hypothetical protein DUI87_25638 [Hirundo rustica rustica]